MELTSIQLLALKRLKGERNISTSQLANELQVSRDTITRVLKRSSVPVRPTTVKKINNWIIYQYVYKYTPVKEVQA